MIRLPEHIAAVMIEMALRSDGGKLAIFGDEVVERLSNQFEIECPHGLAEEALAILQDIDGCRALPSPLTGPYYQINANDAAYYFGNTPSFYTDRGDDDYDAAQMYATDRQIFQEKYPVISTYFSADPKWFSLIVAKLADMDLAREFYVDKLPSEPSADEQAVVLPKSAELVAIREGLSDLEKDIRENNEAGQILGDDKDAVLAEVSALRRIFDSSRVRLAFAASHAKSTLGWIAEKGAGAAIGELAKKLLHLIIGLLS